MGTVRGALAGAATATPPMPAPPNPFQSDPATTQLRAPRGRPSAPFQFPRAFLERPAARVRAMRAPFTRAPPPTLSGARDAGRHLRGGRRASASDPRTPPPQRASDAMALRLPPATRHRAPSPAAPRTPRGPPAKPAADLARRRRQAVAAAPATATTKSKCKKGHVKRRSGAPAALSKKCARGASPRHNSESRSAPLFRRASTRGSCAPTARSKVAPPRRPGSPQGLVRGRP